MVGPQSRRSPPECEASRRAISRRPSATLPDPTRRSSSVRSTTEPDTATPTWSIGVGRSRAAICSGSSAAPRSEGGPGRSALGLSSGSNRRRSRQMFQVGGETVFEAGKRATLWRDLAQRLLDRYDGLTQVLLDSAGARLGGRAGLLARLAEFDAFADPLQKKSFLFAKIADRRGWFAAQRPRELGGLRGQRADAAGAALGAGRAGSRRRYRSRRHARRLQAGLRGQPGSRRTSSTTCSGSWAGKIPTCSVPPEATCASRRGLTEWSGTEVEWRFLRVYRELSATRAVDRASASLARMRIAQELVDEMVAHAREDEPNECCGMIGGVDGKAASVHRVDQCRGQPASLRNGCPGAVQRPECDRGLRGGASSPSTTRTPRPPLGLPKPTSTWQSSGRIRSR